MGLVVNTDVAALRAHRNLSVTDGHMGRSLERLSSGLRINRAADDAAGLAISEGLRSRIGGLKVAVRNTQDAVSVLQTAEGALAETHGVLQRMRDLSVQAANSGGLDAEVRGNIQSEMVQLKSELDRIADTTAFDGTRLLDGSYRGTFQVGADAGDTLSVTIGTAMGAAGLGVLGVDVTMAAAPQTYEWLPGGGVTAPGQVSVTTPASDTQAAIVTWQKPTGTADFSGPAYDVSAYRGLGGVLGFAGRSFDLASVTYDPTADTDGNGTVDSDDLLAQLNVAVCAALGLGVGPFLTPPATGHLQFYVRDAVPGYTDDHAGLGIGTALSDSASDRTRATPTFAPTGGSLGSIAAAIATVSTVRADLGAVQNRLEHTIANLGVAVENLTASQSRIRDADMAQETVGLTRHRILAQAATAMLAQAGRTPEGLVSLLG